MHTGKQIIDGDGQTKVKNQEPVGVKKTYILQAEAQKSIKNKQKEMNLMRAT